MRKLYDLCRQIDETTKKNATWLEAKEKDPIREAHV